MAIVYNIDYVHNNNSKEIVYYGLQTVEEKEETCEL